ncbi:MAG TPA: DUF1800 domain-containing protein [Vicinamibacterales bacterium]|nr:DUF1800 domain-containing protein [Vicinamibacterales bacterium]
MAVLAIGVATPTAGPAQTDAAVAVHVLNRIAFGPRPGDVERVQAIGLDRYIDEQLHPERIADRAMAARLADLTTVRLSEQEIVNTIEVPQMEARRAQKQAAAGGDPNGAPPPRNPMQQRASDLVVELAEQKILRATYSERQLQEVLADFWFNHFNVDARKGRDRFFLTAYERDTIRPHVLGRFRDLLGATAKSPAMLFYLDNWMNVDPNGPHPETRPARLVRGPFGGRAALPPAPRPQAQSQQAKKGLNENYARELMELHTLGVDGGYTQKDVTEVARAFTGWTIENPRQGGGFIFNRRLHDPGQKVVLGHVIKAGGDESDGEQVLDILAKHPATARFIATKLVRRFVSDAPPAPLVERVAKRLRDTDGDLREAVRTILTAPEFASPDVRAAKVKSPFEFVVSAVRATGADPVDAKPLVRQLQQMGMPLYVCQPPTGYKETADAWVNTGALVNRINFALKLAQNDQAMARTLGAPEFQKR